VIFLGWLTMVLPGKVVYWQATTQIENATLTYPCCMN